MAETILNPTSNPATIVVDSGDRRRDYGRAADHLAYETMTTSKDVLTNLNVHGGRMDDKFTGLNTLVADAQFRTLERFGVSDVLTERNGGDTRTLLAKIAGEITTQATLNAKDGIIDSAKNAAAATLLAVQNAAAAAAQLAECCCELKIGQRDQTDRVLAAITDNERRNSDRRETNLKIELSNCEQLEKIRTMIITGGIVGVKA